LVLVKEPVVVSQIFIRFGRMKAGQCLWWKKVIILTGLVYRLNLRNKRTKQANKTSEQNKRTKQANKINIEKQKRIISWLESIWRKMDCLRQRISHKLLD